MELAPLPLVALLGKPLAFAVYGLIGVAFGAVLEAAGFANSRKLAAQFYLSDMTVLKVMFTGIVVAMVLVFLTSSLGLLAFDRVYVPPTYLAPAVVGGLIMGVGFILGGFCPGTSLVAVASLKIDGWFFLLGTLGGIALFGETAHLFSDFWYGTYMGRFILPEWLGWSTGATVVAVVVMALGAFAAAEWSERALGGRAPRLPIAVGPLGRPSRLAGAGVLVALSLVLMAMGQPTPERRWQRMAGEHQARIADRAIQMHPGEFVAVATNRQLALNLVDVRDESDYNRFHLVDAERIPLADIEAGRTTKRFLALAPNTVTIVVSNDEARATDAWRWLVAEGVPNVYVLEGGVNGWLTRFAPDGGCDECRPLADATAPADETLRWSFPAARGARYPIADPDHFADRAFLYPAVLEMEVRTPISGGCG